ncbi:hypothetical protein TNCV_2427431 [Trichonephila clavipes]|nr:hypothetical protein TNCV_2427431 [Trichonephila clavipes]
MSAPLTSRTVGDNRLLSYKSKKSDGHCAEFLPWEHYTRYLSAQTFLHHWRREAFFILLIWCGRRCRVKNSSPYDTEDSPHKEPGEESDPVDDETDEDEDNNNNESSEGPSNARFLR